MTTFLLLALLGAKSSACQPELPETLKHDLGVMFPLAKVMTPSLLTSRERRLVETARPGQCPGVAALDFFGDGKTDYAIVLAHGSTSRMAILVLARPGIAGAWSFELLDEANQGAAVVFAVPPGDYDDVYGAETLHAVHGAIGFSGIESWTELLSWNGTAIERIWTQD